MAISLVGGGAGTARSTTAAITGVYGQSPTAGNLLLAVVTATGNAIATFSCSQTSGTTGWTQLTSPVPNNLSGSSHTGVVYWWKKAAGGDAAPGFTAGVSGTIVTECVIFELAGANTSAPLDTSGSYSSGSTALTSPPTMTPATAGSVTSAGEFAVSAFVQDNQAADTQTWTELGSGWTSIYNDSATSLVAHTVVNYQAGPTAGASLSDSGHFSTGTANMYAAAMVAVIAIPAGGATGAGTLPQVTAAGTGVIGVRNILQPPTGTAWFGAYPGSPNLDPSVYEGPTMASQLLALVVRYQGWDAAWPSAADMALVAPGSGRTALACRWSGRLNAGGFAQYTDISAGVYDSVISAAAARWSAWGAPMIVSFAGEFDGAVSQGQYATALVASFGAGSPQVAAAFVAAYQHIWNLVSPSCPNVVWDWNPTGNNLTSFVASMYPGDGYVDWIGNDVYDTRNDKGGPGGTFSPFMNWLGGPQMAGAGKGVGKPVGIFETGVGAVSAGGVVADVDEATWISSVPADLATLGIQAFCWWNSSTWTIPPSSLSSAALATIADTAFFNPSAFSGSGAPSLPQVTSAGAGTVAGTFSGTGSPSLSAVTCAGTGTSAGVPVTGFQMFPLTITAELLINGTWTDIGRYLYQRDGVTITGGRQDEGTQAQPAQLTLTVNNRDGRFSPLYSGGAYFPFLQRNTQIRLSVTATSSSGNFYSGYRFWGEVSVWPPLSDISGHDIYVQVTASGPLRRIRTGGGKGSALTRYYASLTGNLAPVAYWPCEEDPDTDIIGAGIEGGTNMAVVSGSPTWKAISDFNGSAPVGVLNGSVWDGLTGSFGNSGDDLFVVPGSFIWYASTPTVNVKVTGAGGGGDAGAAGFPGGGGESAQEATLAVTVGNPYTVTVGAGGKGGTVLASAAKGGDSSFPGDSVTVTGHGGGFGHGSTAGAGGTGSANTVHHNGGAGFSGGGGGGGGSGGTSAAGNTGSSGAGGAAVTGGGPGGSGGGGSFTAGHMPGTGPGGGGGGSSTVNGQGGGGAGYSGQVELIYTPGAQPTVNVTRFILMVPGHGGNRSKILVRALTSGTIRTLDVSLNSNSTGLVITGRLLGGGTAFTGTLITPVNGQTLMVSAELKTAGTGVAWKLTAIRPGASMAVGSVTGTYASAVVGNVSEILAGPNGDISKTAIGHISVQYALADITKVSNALNGHVSEMTIDRFIRLCNEQAIDNVPQFNETADHWGFTTGTQGWGGVNGAVAQSSAWASQGTTSLRLTANGAGPPSAFSPSGTSGQPVNPGDIVSVAAELFAPTGVNRAYLGIEFFNGAGTSLGEHDCPDTVLGAGGGGTGGGGGLVGAFLKLIDFNWLTDGTANFESGTGTWVGSGNATTGATSAQAHNGTGAMALTSIASGNMSAGSCTAALITSQGLPILSGAAVSCSAWFRAAVSARNCQVGATFYTSAGVLISTVLVPTGVTDSTSAWTLVTGQVTAPATSAFCRLTTQVNATGAAAEVHYVDDAQLGPATKAQAISQWITLLGRPLDARREYFGLSFFPGAITTDFLADAAAGRKVCMTLSPAYNPVSATDRTNLGKFLASCSAAGLQADVTLWHEPFYSGLSPAQYVAMVNYYGPTVRQYYPLVFVTANSAVINNGENTWYPGDSQIDKIATDYYAQGYVSGNTLDLAASIADNASPPKPFGIWELNASTDPVSGQTTTQGTNYFAYIKSFMDGRANAGKPNADLLIFDADTLATQETPITMPGDYRIALWQAQYDDFAAARTGAVASPAAATLKHTFTAPATAATFSVHFGDHNTDASGTLLYCDNVRVTPRMGAQTRKELHKFLEEIQDLDQGILKEAKTTLGLGYRTRISLINQTPAVILDYSQAMLSPPLAPVIDDQRTVDDVVVHRHKGSKVRLTAQGGGGSGPGGSKRNFKVHKVAAETDAQLLALAQHLLNLGTVTTERFPTVTVSLSRASIPGNALAPLMSAVAGAEIGDLLQLNSLPFWMPSSQANQLIIGYSEVINAREWTCTFNCIPASAFTLVSTSIRRW